MAFARLTRAPLLLAIAVTFSAAAIAAPAVAEAPAAAVPNVRAVAAVPTDVSDFTFASFTGDYALGRDGSGRSTLDTTETLVAVFPDIDQNRGIIRAIPTNYDGHNTHISVRSVTDGSGAARSYAMGTDGDFTTITIAVPEGRYVHGNQTYVIRYTQLDVTKTFANTNDQEFYWDTNGTGWSQPFGEVSATVRLDPSLTSALNGHKACYFGYQDSTDTCAITGTGSTFTASVSNVYPTQNMTLAIGFVRGTFADAPFDLLQIIPLNALLGIFALLLSAICAVLLRFAALRDHPGKGIVVPQYEPQKDVSAWLAANILDLPRKGMPATIIDLAVRGKLKILERTASNGHSKEYGVEEIDDSRLEQDAKQAMYILFSTGFFTSPSQPERWFVSRDTILGGQVDSLAATVAAEELSLGLRRKGPSWPTAVMVILGVLAFLLFLFGAIFGGNSGPSIAIGVVGANVVPWLTIFLVSRVAGRTPLTDAGSDVRDYLKGLELYIRLAEADRLKMLQSVTGAERVPADDAAPGPQAVGNPTTRPNNTQIVKIYERLLPYALIFGLEKEWAGVLEKYYDATPPDWYSGSDPNAFRMGGLALGLGSFSSSVSSSARSYSSSGGSSDGGGSFGGGSSGGGGGGGGGGGI